MRFPLLCLLAVLFLARAGAEESFLKKGEVIAVIGGEDMVVSSEYGYLELLLTRALPDYQLRFRNLAWEGDTVFKQFRDLNFPSWEEQLDKIGATVVICQFGQMESLNGRANLSAFTAAYQNLLERFAAVGKRRIVLVAPSPIWWTGIVSEAAGQRRADDLNSYAQAIKDLAQKAKFPFVETYAENAGDFRRDGTHLSAAGQFHLALNVAESLAPIAAVDSAAATQPVHSQSLLMPKIDDTGRLDSPEREALRQLIVAKNRLWFNYWRPQNWAFLFGDRTNQPSSRDWRDPSKRWFPTEREEFVPLIEAKEKEIDAAAAKQIEK
jgi:hypothetical protein